MSKKENLKDLILYTKSLAQQLHDIRISKQLSLEQVSCETGVPEYVIDRMELGYGNVNLGRLYILAKYYGKKVQISLVDRT